MFPSALTRVCPERSGAPYTVISTSSPGPMTSAEKLAGGVVFCSGDPARGGVAVPDGSVVTLPGWVASCTGPLFCATASWSNPTMPSTTTGFKTCERKFEVRCITLLDSKPRDADAQPEVRRFIFLVCPALCLRCRSAAANQPFPLLPATVIPLGPSALWRTGKNGSDIFPTQWCKSSASASRPVAIIKMPCAGFSRPTPNS